MRRSRFVTVCFKTDRLGYARPVRTHESMSADEARRFAALTAMFDAGCVSFRRTVDVEAGRYKADAEVIAAYGAVDLDQLRRWRRYRARR